MEAEHNALESQKAAELAEAAKIAAEKVKAEEELARIVELGTATAAMKCFLDDFNDACRVYVKTEIMNYGATVAASG